MHIVIKIETAGKVSYYRKVKKPTEKEIEQYVEEIKKHLIEWKDFPNQ